MRFRNIATPGGWLHYGDRRSLRNGFDLQREHRPRHYIDVAGTIGAARKTPLSATPKLEQSAVRRSARELLAACVAMLPDFHALVIVLRNRGLSYREIARSAGIACHKVIQRTEQAALTTLRHMLNKLGVYRMADAI